MPTARERHRYCRNQYINHSLIRMLGSRDAEKISQLLEKHLAHAGITTVQTSIVSIVLIVPR